MSTKKGQNKEEKHLFYKRYRNKLNHLLRSAERKYYQDMLKEHRSNVKRCWQILKMIINKNKNMSVTKRFLHNGKIVDGKEIADRFNNFFVNVGSTLAKAIPPVSKSPTEYIKENMMNCFYIRPVTEIEIVNIISDFKDSAAGWDELKPSVIRGIKEFIKMPLRHICNLSFNTGVFPWELKVANVVPIFKSGDDMLFSNYRPVSVLPVFSKVIERLMYNRLIGFINDNDLLYEYQFGFQKGKSTYMALVILLDKISEALENGECVVGVFLDFSKAFDTVDHDILLMKMKSYGIIDTAYDWFKSYLCDRVQYVTYNAMQSNRSAITCGVPQGSILGPLLFLLYINDLSSVLKSCFSVLVADDTDVFIKGKNLQELCNRLNDELTNIQNWLSCNKLSLNVLKTHYIIFTPRNKIVDSIDIKINNTAIERVYNTKFLGVHIDSQLSWKKQIDYTCKKII